MPFNSSNNAGLSNFPFKLTALLAVFFLFHSLKNHPVSFKYPNIKHLNISNTITNLSFIFSAFFLTEVISSTLSFNLPLILQPASKIAAFLSLTPLTLLNYPTPASPVLINPIFLLSAALIICFFSTHPLSLLNNKYQPKIFDYQSDQLKPTP